MRGSDEPTRRIPIMRHARAFAGFAGFRARDPSQRNDRHAKQGNDMECATPPPACPSPPRPALLWHHRPHDTPSAILLRDPRRAPRRRTQRPSALRRRSLRNLLMSRVRMGRCCPMHPRSRSGFRRRRGSGSRRGSSLSAMAAAAGASGSICLVLPMAPEGVPTSDHQYEFRRLS